MSDLRVTSLLDDPAIEGTLRWCLEQPGENVITTGLVGDIDLVHPKKLKVRHPRTVLDLSGGMVTLYGAQIQVAASRVTLCNVRHRGLDILRRHPGWVPPTGWDDYDVLQIGAPDVLVEDAFVQDCSFSGGADEVVQVWYPGTSAFFRRCLITQGYVNAPNAGQSGHSMAVLVGGGARHASFFDCLLGACHGRLPQIAGSSATMVGCSVYGWRDSALTIKGESNGRLGDVSIIVTDTGFRTGPESRPQAPVIRLDPSLQQVNFHLDTVGLSLPDGVPAIGWSDGADRELPTLGRSDRGMTANYRTLVLAGAKPVSEFDFATKTAIASATLGAPWLNPGAIS